MKKALKNSLFAVIILSAVVLLTGCGASANVLTATKTTEQNGMKMEEKMEITFDSSDKVEKVVETMTFDNEAMAQLMAAYLGGEEEDGVKFEQNGNSIIMTLDAKAYAEKEESNSESISKDAIIQSLEEEGYTVK